MLLPANDFSLTLTSRLFDIRVNDSVIMHGELERIEKEVVLVCYIPAFILND
jgi:hypothetical protein